jgi:hypothetical protein
MTPREAIAEFNQKLLLPLYAEIQSSPRMTSKGRTIAIADAPPSGDSLTDGLIEAAHGARKHVSTFDGAPGEYFGATLVIVEPPELRAPYKHLQAGRFYMTALFSALADGVVSVAPYVAYWMRFNDKLHAFPHRYDNARAVYPIEQATRKDLVNHALGAISAFDMSAFRETNPF